MAQNSSPHTDFSTLQDAPITTSANNKELAKHIKDISQQVLKRNYELYKALDVNVNIRMYNFDDVQCTVIPSVAYGFVTGMNLQLC